MQYTALFVLLKAMNGQCQSVRLHGYSLIEDGSGLKSGEYVTYLLGCLEL